MIGMLVTRVAELSDSELYLITMCSIGFFVALLVLFAIFLIVYVRKDDE